MNAEKKQTLPTNFVTPRLLLAELTPAHAEFILTLLNTPGWLRFIGERNVRTREDAVSYINRINDNATLKYWVVTLKTDGQPIGIITFIQRDYLDAPDLGFAFLPGYQRAGYASEAAASVVNYCAEAQLFDHFLAVTLPDNEASIRLLLKLGFALQQTIESAGQELLVYHLSLT